MMKACFEKTFIILVHLPHLLVQPVHASSDSSGSSSQPGALPLSIAKLDIVFDLKQIVYFKNTDRTGEGQREEEEVNTMHAKKRQTDRMEVKLLWMSVLLSTPILTLCDPLFILSAPNLLRVGSPENILVEAQDYNGDALSVRISVKNFPAKNIEVFSKVVTLPKGTFQILTDIEIPADSNIFSDDEEKHFVFLQAQFPSVTLEKVILVSFQSGYIFIQTDKPIYTPSSTVRYRIFSVMPNLVSPSSETAVTVDIMNPQNITIESYQLSTSKGVKSTNFILPKLGTTGFWKIIARYTRSPKKTFTAEFEVKEYVLPTFEIKLKTSKSYYYVGSKPTTLELTIEATYLFGQKVYGNAYVIFGVMQGETKTALEHSLQKVTINDGVGTAVLTREMIEKTFKHLTELIGDSIYISVNVLTESGSEMVEAERRGIQIVTSPYTIRFERTAHFYKPGMPFDVAVLVTNPDGTPAGNVEVKITPGDSSGVTKPNGITKVKVNTPGDSRSLTITAKTNDEGLTSEQQDSKTLTAQAYQSIANSQNYLHIGIDSPEFEIGDTATVNLYTGKSPGVTNQDVTYMILSKGQIVKAGRFKREGQALVALSLPVTKDMVPSFRFVAYYNVGSNEVVSDSVWVDVKDTCMGKLQLEVKEKKDLKFFDTGKKITLQITGDPGAKVGLVVVDKAVHVLNKNRLTQTKIWDVVEKHDTGCTGGSGADNMGVFTDAGLAFESNTAGGTKTRTGFSPSSVSADLNVNPLCSVCGKFKCKIWNGSHL
ncbi:hypothetical protein DNTS_017205 [Danionella cerebrum]|uniref:Alpha-2-macroglobulin bait region domain-containing protein n=1 Tax=Danionella cerebrum TaxID=2873325 RepID=A0A553QBM0_9TELE|nr:hypothetical protein DNTS_017205 [Danionella translucida]TRY87331.1 hypothetical protein DNTS_017205 [Danionella translucida]